MIENPDNNISWDCKSQQRRSIPYIRRDVGMKLTKDQILQMQKDYDAGKLNQGKQKLE